jgi:1-acyl-sn-glycerol-3-phosphate acyltransferase
METWKLQPAHDLGLPPGQRLKSIRRESGLIATAGHLIWWFIVRIYLRIFHRLQVIGRENLPTTGPFVIVSNHTSHLDALVLASIIPWKLRDCTFPVAAGDTFFDAPTHTFFSAIALNAIPMWRKHAGKHALTEMRQRLIEQNCIFILFPEGTRSRDGKMKPFKAGVGMLVAGTQIPIVPCRLSGTFESLPPGRKLVRFKQISLLIGKPIIFSDQFSDRSVWESITSSAQRSVENLALPSDATKNPDGI